MFTYKITSFDIYNCRSYSVNYGQYTIVELRILIYDSGTSNEKIYKRDIYITLGGIIKTRNYCYAFELFI
ncbi:hypothetical protein CD116_12215 [Staphylococcus schweitzeri]|uniref:Uncharacterized protein n=1 Tax=Staphylococcus schweitzeri TaxID=1654388 RepID=A0A2K4AEX0_9STAP|nr:hypothetical protein CD116_12215 [Staphylococcus schweitzeri]